MQSYQGQVVHDGQRASFEPDGQPGKRFGLTATSPHSGPPGDDACIQLDKFAGQRIRFVGEPGADGWIYAVDELRFDDAPTG